VVLEGLDKTPEQIRDGEPYSPRVALDDPADHSPGRSSAAADGAYETQYLFFGRVERCRR